MRTAGRRRRVAERGRIRPHGKKGPPRRLRQHCPLVREQEAGRFVLDPLDDDATTSWRVQPPTDTVAEVPAATTPYLAAIHEQLAARVFTTRGR